MMAMLAEYLQQHMRRRDVGSKRLADLVNEQFDLHLHRNTIENWRTGAVRRVRDWRPLLAIAVVLHLSTEQANNLLSAASQPTLLQLHLLKREEATPFLNYWHKQAPNTPDMATPVPLSDDTGTPHVTITLADGTCFVMCEIGTFGIGRTDPSQHWFPTIKLEHYGGVAAGVSRKHGAITLTAQAAFVEDYGSHNGTRHNGQRLLPHRRYALADGDELSFSRLAASVQIA